MSRTMTNSQMTWAIKNGFARYETDTGSISDTIWTKDGGWQWFPPCVENNQVIEGHYKLVSR
jgi:hypothetical protein